MAVGVFCDSLGTPELVQVSCCPFENDAIGSCNGFHVIEAGTLEDGFEGRDDVVIRTDVVGDLRFYGKMSLTNYITQSVVGAVIYFPFGLYLAPYCGYTLSLCIGWMVFLLQVAFCKWWLGKHKQGPLEYIWHKWTWIGTKK